MSGKIETVELNGKSLKQEDFDKKKEELECKPGVSVVKVNEGQYRSKIKG